MTHRVMIHVLFYILQTILYISKAKVPNNSIYIYIRKISHNFFIRYTFNKVFNSIVLISIFTFVIATIYNFTNSGCL